MKRLFDFFLGLTLGAAAGYISGLFLTPHAGEENQRLIRQRLNDAIAEGQRAAEARRRELEAELRQAQQRGGL